MQTVMKGQDFTGYYMLRHKACGAATRVFTGKHYHGNGDAGFATEALTANGGAIEIRRSPYGFNYPVAPCKGCGKALRVDLGGKAIYGRYVKEVVCNGKCMGAVGPSCDCSCGGENHGSNH